MITSSAATSALSRRSVLALGAASFVGGVLARPARAQSPKRGGTVTIRAWDPPHFDPYVTPGHNYKTQVAYSFTHSRLLRHRAGPSIAPGSFALEADLAESWTQPSDTTYVFKLRKGVRWHAKPPVNGRELTAEDVVYSVERFRTVTGNANAHVLASVDRVEAVDRHTVKLTLKEPFAWFLDALAQPMTLPIVARECVGIDARLNQKEYGAYVASVSVGKYDAMAFGPQQPYLDPDGYLSSAYAPDSVRNIGHVNDPVATDLLVRQRRTADLAKRRELVNELQRYLATQQHYVQLPSAIAVYVWDGALRNYGPNLGYDYGGRLQAAWLER